jgi:hypothetical protein
MKKTSKVKIVSLFILVFMITGVFSSAANGHNKPPYAQDDFVTMPAAQKAIKIDVLENDDDPDGDIDPTTVVIVTLPLYGKVMVDPLTGIVTYGRNPDFNESDSFQYEVNDTENATSNVATVWINIEELPANNPPVAVDDTASTEEHTPVSIRVLDNDHDDEDGKPKFHSVIVLPRNGTVAALTTDGVLVYVPDEGFVGIDSFQYMVEDSGGLNDTAFVNITVNGTDKNMPPVAVNDTASVPQNEDHVVIVVLDNDYDLDGTLDPTTVTIVEPPTRGNVVVDPVNGTVNYSLFQDFIGIDTFKYTVDDDEGATSNNATVTIRVNNGQTHCSPYAINDSYRTPEDTLLSIAAPGVLDNDFVLALSSEDVCPLSAVLEDDASHGDLILNADGSFDYMPDENWFGNDSFTYRACAGDRCSDPATVSITVIPVNDAPVAVNDSASTDEDSPVEVSVTDNDSDVEDGKPKISGIIDHPDNGIVEILDDDTIRYTPNLGFFGNDILTYEVNDSEGLTDTADVNISVNEVEDPEEPEEPEPTGGGGRGKSSAPKNTNNAPIANLSAGLPYHGFPGEEIIFDASLSYDPDGFIAKYHWHFGDRSDAYEEISAHVYESEGTYIVTLEVWDDKDLKSNPVTSEVIIIQPNRPPNDPQIFGLEKGRVGTRYSFAALSDDLDKDDLKYIFDWGDGSQDESEFLPLPRGTGFSFKHSWDEPGEYTINVTVTDNQSSSSSQFSIVITDSYVEYVAVIILGAILASFIALSAIRLKGKKAPKSKK